MNAVSNQLATTLAWPEERMAPPPALDSYRMGVAGIAAEVILWNGESVTTSFYLRMASAIVAGRETLGERLNDPATRFLPCKVEDKVELLNLKWISYVRVAGVLPEVVQLEEVGAVRQRARVVVQSGYVLEGEFLYVLPTSRCRLSDLLNMSDERFLLFLAPAAALYINRDTIVRVVP
jgi:hypothetical protein